jgi:hypothetical protein
MTKFFTLFLVTVLLLSFVKVSYAQTVPSKCQQYAQLIEEYDWNVVIAAQIINNESTCDSTAHNASSTTGDDSYGLFQVNLYGSLAKSRPNAQWLLNPQNNVAYAYKLYSTPIDPASSTDMRIEGFTPWLNSLTLALQEM